MSINDLVSSLSNQTVTNPEKLDEECFKYVKCTFSLINQLHFDSFANESLPDMTRNGMLLNIIASPDINSHKYIISVRMST